MPFVNYDVPHFPARGDGPVSYRRYFEQSLTRFVDEVPNAMIPIEKAWVILVAGGDDALWTSDFFAWTLADRLTTATSATDYAAQCRSSRTFARRVYAASRNQCAWWHRRA